MADKHARDIPTRASVRSARLAALPIGFAGRAAAGWGRRVAGGDRGEISASVLERNAEHMFAVLGELKGGAMKLGQALSVYEAMIPAEFAEPYRRALTQLQAQGPALPAARVHEVLDQQFGRNWRKHFREFEDVPAAAASIGQVHRGTWHDGRTVAVKVQYPGADVAMQTDLKQLQRFARLFNLVVPGLEARELIAEVRERMMEELDYRSEAEHQRRFAERLGDDPEIRVPHVLASAPKVIVSEWLDGRPLSALIAQQDVTADEQRERDRIADIVVRLMFSSPARLGLLHADPHPGNFLVQDDGRIGVIDFGAVAVLPNGLPRVLGRILRYAADRDAEPMMELLRAERFVTGDVTAEDVLRWLGALADPLRVERFHANREWIGKQGARVANIYSNAYKHTGRALNLPAEHMLVARVCGGWMNILAQLDCTVQARGIATHWVPGFADPETPYDDRGAAP
ncbi:MAG TPA: AarF/ABC1/UbiB kinase family protein [Jatrophihabitantaceae bacterium]|nr:AarF/ABC1/UbiB kinase family protein [Jatrophihabitantaceae bacterium]